MERIDGKMYLDVKYIIVIFIPGEADVVSLGEDLVDVLGALAGGGLEGGHHLEMSKKVVFKGVVSSNESAAGRNQLLVPWWG